MQLSDKEKQVIKNRLASWKVDEQEATAEWVKAKEEVSKLHSGDKDPDSIIERVIGIVTAVLRPKSYAGRNTKTFRAILISTEEPRDMWANQRVKIMAHYNKLKEEGRQQEAFIGTDGKKPIVALDDKGAIVPLCPEKNARGEPSGTAGKPMASPEESQIQSAIAIGYDVSNKEQRPVPIYLTLRTQACIKSFIPEQIYEFTAAIDNFQKEEFALSLSTSNTVFKPVDDEKLKSGMSRLGLTGVIENLFKNYLIEQKDLQAWEKAGAVPERFKNLAVIRDALLTSVNLAGNKKGNINFNIEQSYGIDKVLTGEERHTFCSGPKSKLKINFAKGSVVMVVGRPWLTENQDKTKIMNFSASAILPYPGKFIPAIEAQPITEADLPDEAAAGQAVSDEDIAIASEESDPWRV